MARLDDIIDWSMTNGSTLGYFPALYRRVTAAVRDRIDAGNFFDDAERMERLDVTFANRYLDAWEQYQSGGAPTGSWAYAFRAANDFWPIVLQHLLLGMNAHINLDLGIAAAQTVVPRELPSLQDDFNRINEILAGLVGDVQSRLARIWRPLTLLNQMLGDVDDAIVNFSMTRARDEAWKVAQRLAPIPPLQRDTAVRQLDGDVVAIARIVRRPGVLLGSLTKLIRIGEIGTTRNKIELLR